MTDADHHEEPSTMTTTRMPKKAADALIARLAERMRTDAETGMPTRILNGVNFRALATSAFLEIEADLVQRP
jgi:hypothetical protein